MSVVFKVGDRAYCMNAGSSALQVGKLYCVAAVQMSRSGEQSLSLVGMEKDWYNATRFSRIPDPTPRRWPASQ